MRDADFKPECFYDFNDLRDRRIICSRSALHRNLKNREFPAPVRLPGNRIAWRGVTLNAYLRAVEAGAAPNEATHLASAILVEARSGSAGASR